MQDHPQVSVVAKDAAATQAKLKELRDSGRDPWDKDTEFARQKLRRLYLQLLLLFPYTPQSKKVDMRMWLETSHNFISAYKERLAQLDKIISTPQESRPPSRNRHGPVEYRKLAQRFRQFLAEEEKFWIAFVTRFVRSFSLDEAHHVLSLLGIAVSEPEPDHVSSGNNNNNNSHSRSRSNVFPEEGDQYAVGPHQRAERMLILSKSLVCIGDIARYREQWNESGGRPKGGKESHDEAPGRGGGGRGGRRREPAPRARNYARARDCYDYARSIFPDSGNASHQLAILSSYESDIFQSLYHYYRSLCVRQPHSSALENMEKQMNRYLETHLPTYKLALPEGEELVPPEKVKHFKESIVVLHSLWRSNQTDKYDLQAFSDAITTQLEHQVTERILPPEMICKAVVLAIGSLWIHRLYRGSTARESRRASIEVFILGHVLDTYRTLMQIGISQLADTTRTPADSNLDLAQHITAVLRRMLPALRICSKWLKCNLDAICGADAPSGPEISDTMAKLWDSYIDFSSLLLRVFPLEALQPLRSALDEDVDLSGFAPLKKLLIQIPGITMNFARVQSEFHPNEEQLMRIHDLLRDAMDITTMKDSPIDFSNGKFVLRQKDAFCEPASSPLIFVPPSVSAWRATQKPAVQPVEEVEDDIDAHTVSTRTEDDPVRLAMDATLRETPGDSDDEEQILYPIRNLATPGRSRLPVAPVSPTSPMLRPPLHNRTTSTTASDLVNLVLGGRHVNEPAAHPRVQPLLFGSNMPNSIWSTSLDTGSPSAMGATTSFSQSSLPTQTQSSWGSPVNPTSPSRAFYQQPPTAPAFPQSMLPPSRVPFAPPTQVHSSYAPFGTSPLRQSMQRPRNYFDSPTMQDPYNPFPIQQHHPAAYPLQGPTMQTRWS